MPDRALEALAQVPYPRQTLPAGSHDVGHSQLVTLDAHGGIDAASDPRTEGGAEVVRL